VAGSARRITVEFIGDGKNLSGELSNIEGKTHKFGAAMAKAGKYALLGLGAGLAAAGVAGVKFAQSAADDAQAAELMATAFRNNARATDEQIASAEDWITLQGKQKGVADDELRPALSRLVTATHDVGEAQKLATLAMDVSAGSGKSLEAVSTALMKAQNGQVSSLSRLGINTKNAAGETIGMDEAVQRMAETFGGAAAAKADTFQGKMDRLKLMMSETGESIGYKLIPIGVKLMDWVNDSAIPGMQKLGDWLETHVVPVLQDVGHWIQDTVVPAIQNFVGEMQSGEGSGGKFVDVLHKLKDALSKAYDILQPVFQFMADNKTVVATFAGVILTVVAAVKTWTAVQAALNVVMSANPLGLVVIAVAALAAGLVYAYKKSETFRDVVETVFSTVGKIMRSFWNDFAQPILHFLVEAIAQAAEGFADMLDGLSHVPGFGWVKGAADGLHKAAEQGRAFADQIQKIPEHKTVTVDLIVNRSAINKNQDMLGPTSGRLLSGKGGGSKDDPWGLGPNHIGNPGAALINSIVKGIETGKVKLQTALDKLRDYIKKHQDKLADLLGKRQEIVDAFKGFASSIFGADTGFAASKDRQDQIAALNEGILDKKKDLAKAQADLAKATADQEVDAAASAADRIKSIQDEIAKAGRQVGLLQAEDAAAPKGLDALLAFQANEKTKAQGLLADVNTLISKGISQDLLTQLQGAGSSGEEQIHLLAGATAEQLKQANDDNAATLAALQAAGLAASEAQGVEAAIRQEEANIKLADTIKGKLQELLDLQDKNTIVELHLDGQKIYVSLKKLKKQLGHGLDLG
jgi:hypothetical protein